MRKTILVVLMACWTPLVMAKKERSSICEPRVPSVTLVDVIEKVESFYYQDDMKKEPIFIDEAKLKCLDGVLIWVIGYRREAYESGHMIVTVNMDGTVKLKSVVKDG